MKFLIDECLSPALVGIAVEAGYPESSHVTHRGMGSWKDHQIMRAILDQDWTLVTRNSDDFRPPRGSRSQSPCYVGVELHPGLICLNPPPGSRALLHQLYFRAALHELGAAVDLTNEVLEVWPDPDDPNVLAVERYQFPTS